MVEGADRGDAVHLRGDAVQVLTDADAAHGSVEGVVVGAGLLLLRVGPAFGVKRVDLTHAAAEPDVDAVLGLAARTGGRIGGEQLRNTEAGGGRGEKLTAVQRNHYRKA